MTSKVEERKSREEERRGKKRREEERREEKRRERKRKKEKEREEKRRERGRGKLEDRETEKDKRERKKEEEKPIEEREKKKRGEGRGKNVRTTQRTICCRTNICLFSSFSSLFFSISLFSHYFHLSLTAGDLQTDKSKEKGKETKNDNFQGKDGPLGHRPSRLDVSPILQV